MRPVRAQHELVPIGRRIRHACGARHPACTGGILDNDGAAQVPGEMWDKNSTIRPRRSGALPAANGITIVSGRIGQSWANADPSPTLTIRAASHWDGLLIRVGPSLRRP